MYSSNQFETSGDIQSIILCGTTILENFIHLPCHRNWWGCIVYRIHKLPYLEVKIPYKTRTTHVYSLLFFRNEHFDTCYLKWLPLRNNWWPDFFLGSQGATNVSWLHNQWQPNLLATGTTSYEKDRFRKPKSDTHDWWMSRWKLVIKRLGFQWIFLPQGIPHLEGGSLAIIY